MSGQKRKQNQKARKFYLLGFTKTWYPKDDLPDVSGIEDIYYKNRDKVKVEDVDDVQDDSTVENPNEGSSNATNIQQNVSNKQFVCMYCGKEFSCKSNFTQHIRIHTGEKPFECIVCDKKFSLKGSLKLHLRTHTNKHPYACTQCEFTCSTKGHLTYHIRIHTAERNLILVICAINRW